MLALASHGTRDRGPFQGAELAKNTRFLVSATKSARQSPEWPEIFPETGDGPNSGTAWLGREDSNLRMAESKSAALPLGDAPIVRPGAKVPRRGGP
jgi:hypothetical protein